MNYLLFELAELSSNEKEYIISYVNNHKGSVISPFIVIKYLSGDLGLEELKFISTSLDSSISTYWPVQYIKDRVTRLEKSAIGCAAPDFAMRDSAGVLHSVSSLKGKYVLLDFAQQMDMMEMIENRHGKSSTIVTSQLPVESWYDVLGEETLADAIMDRLVHTAYRIECVRELKEKSIKLSVFRVL